MSSNDIRFLFRYVTYVLFCKNFCSVVKSWCWPSLTLDESLVYDAGKVAVLLHRLPMQDSSFSY